MARIKMLDGVAVPLTPEEETERDIEEAAALADKPAREKAIANSLILTQIDIKEKLSLRPILELRRAQEHADVPAADVAFAKNRIKVLDDEIKALRAQLQ